MRSEEYICTNKNVSKLYLKVFSEHRCTSDQRLTAEFRPSETKWVKINSIQIVYMWDPKENKIDDYSEKLKDWESMKQDEKSFKFDFMPAACKCDYYFFSIVTSIASIVYC